MAEGERKLAAIMFSDMVGYSALAQRHEALALALLADHQATLRPIFVRHGGRVIKITGDGVSIAARVEPLADAGGICVTGSVFDQVRNKIEEPLERLRLRGAPAPRAKELDPRNPDVMSGLGHAYAAAPTETGSQPIARRGVWRGCSRSTSASPRTCRGGGRGCTPVSGSVPSPVPAWCDA